jgi:hypothetical protein
VAALAGCGGAPVEKSDWELKHESQLQSPSEPPVSLPRYPPRGELLEFSAGPSREFRFFIEDASLSVAGGIVRYTLVARSAEGVQNVSYEGMRCETGEVRIYAVGRDGGWSGTPGAWRSPLAWHRPLYRDYFCPFRQAIHSPAEGIAALRR